MIAVSGRSALAFVFAVIFVGMGVYFLRYFERQRRLDNMTEEERARSFFANGGAILMPHEVERLNREKEEKRRLRKKIGALTEDAVRLERRRFCSDHWRKKFGKLP